MTTRWKDEITDRQRGLLQQSRKALVVYIDTEPMA